MMKSIAKKLGAFIALMLLVAGSVAYAQTTEYFKMYTKVVSTCVPGITGQETAKVEIWINTGATTSVSNTTFFVTLPDGVTVTTSDVVWGSCVKLNADGSSRYSATIDSTGKLKMVCTGSPSNTAINANANDQLLCTIPFVVDASKAGSDISLTFDLAAVAGSRNGTGINKATYLGTNPDVPSAIEFTAYKSFSIAKEANFETTENDDDSPAAVVIAANNTDVFTCKGWNGTQLAQVTTGVTFESVKWKNDESTNGKCTEVYGTLGINDSGNISYTPRQYWYGTTDTVVATAKWTGSNETAEVEFQIVAKAIQTQPVVELTTPLTSFEWTEGQWFGEDQGTDKLIPDSGKKFVLTYINYDAAQDLPFVWQSYWGNTGIFSNCDRGEIAMDRGGSVGDGTGSIAYYKGTLTCAFTMWDGPSNIITYDTVSHPDKSRTEALSFTAQADSVFNGAMVVYSIDQELGDMTINDSDVVPTGTAITAFTPAEPKVGDTLAITATEGTDADGDTITLEYQWYKDDSAIEGATSSTYALTDATKGETYKCVVKAATDPYNNGEICRGAEVVSSEVTVLNTEPVVADSPRSLFVQRGVATSGNISITVSDADGIDDVVLMDADGNGTTTSVTSEQGGTANLSIDDTTGAINVEYTIPESFKNVMEDKKDSFKFYVGDMGNNWRATKCTLITIDVDYKENPVPVITDLGEAVTIKEVDENGQPTMFSVSVKATDSEVYPAGVSEWDVEVPEGWTVSNKQGTTGSVTEGTWEGTFTADITCAGYDTITGKLRPVSSDFTVTIKAKDATTGAWGTLAKTVTVQDVDRKPTGEVTITFESEDIKYNDTVKVSGATGATDADGDEITYAYTWFYREPNSKTETATGTTGDSFANNDYVIKDNVIIVKAQAWTTPYDADTILVTDLPGSNELTVGNTAPYIVKIDEGRVVEVADTVPDATYTAEVEQQDAEDADNRTFSLTVTVKDPDVDCGRDTLKFDLEAWDEESNGEVSINETTGLVTIILPKNYNNAAMDEKPVSVIKVADDDTDSLNKGYLYLAVSEKNLAPVVSAFDQYVLPAMLGTSQSAEFMVNMGSKYEENQSLTAATITAVEGEDTSIFDVLPTVIHPESGDDLSATVSFDYTVKADAEMGKSCKFAVKVTDNGTTNGAADPKESEVAYFTIYVGATPWYPIITLNCANTDEHTEGHVVVLTDNEGGEYEMVIRPANADGTITVLPKDYAAIGHPGYKAGVEVTATAYNWTVKEGKDDQVDVANDALTVSDYTVPGAATTDATSTELTDTAEDGVVEIPAISIPMAQKYVIEVIDQDGKVVLTQKADFTADEETGMILPNIPAQNIKLSAGTYTLEARGINPEGEGEATELFTITVTGNADDEVTWPEDGTFTPKANATLNASPVKFSWPAATGAQSYDLYVFDQDGKKVVSKTGLNTLNATADLEIEEDNATSYSWYVRANGANKNSVDSKTFSFTLAESITSFAVTSLTVDGDGKVVMNIEGSVNSSDAITVDFQYFTMKSDNRWYNRNGKAATISADGQITIDEIKDVNDNAVAEVKAGDYVALRYYINGKLVNTWTVYCIGE